MSLSSFLSDGGEVIRILTTRIRKTAKEKGFWAEPEMMDKYAGKLALVHSEVTEILEALRKRQGADKVTEEFADVLIRTFDLHGKLVEDGEATNDLWAVTLKKMDTNDARKPLHGHRWG